VISPILQKIKPDWANAVLAVVAIHSFWFFGNSNQIPSITGLLTILCVLPAIAGVAIALKLKVPHNLRR
jgi:hypothetical protein